MNAQDDTIAAISTPPGRGGIGVVRVSGKNAPEITGKVFKAQGGGDLTDQPTHTVRYGHIVAPGGDPVDEVLVTLMRTPRSYTAEDVVEISCHGGIISLRKVLELVVSAGARPAEPGEFTKRAFLNGKLDLSQAEAVLDVINAETDTSCKMALEQLSGGFSDRVNDLRSKVIDVLSNVELGIDFSDEDVVSAEAEKIRGDVLEVRDAVKELIGTYEKGMILKEGVRAVICGRPNVGKSSLMNSLLGRDRVIVTPVPGTTRDIVEESISLSGILIRLSDTAGIIETQDRVEIEGIKRSKARLEEADLVIFMIDSNKPLSKKDEEIYNTVRDKKVIIVANKTDLARELDLDDASAKLGGRKILESSVLKGEGISGIEEAVTEGIFGDGSAVTEGALVTNIRHKELLDKAREALERSIATSGVDSKTELLASDLKEAAYQLGLITGKEIGDDVLDRIFSRFCIGK